MTIWRLIGVTVMLVAAQAAMAETATSTDTAEPRDQVEAILNEDIYQRWKLRQPDDGSRDPFGIHETARRWRQWLWDMLDRGSESQSSDVAERGDGSGLAEGLRILGWAVVTLGVAFLGFVAFRVLRERKPSPATAQVISEARVREALDAGEALALEAPQWLREAERLGQSQDLRAMYRALYLALLSGLHHKRKIDFRANRTNWTYVQQYRGEDAERAVFHRLTAAFDEVWYGRHLSAAPDVGQVEREVAMLIDERGAAS